MAFLYDPRYVEEADIYAAQPGLRMRVRADQFGNAPKSLSEIVHQLHVHDVTAGFWNDIGLQSQVVKQALGAPDVMQGMPAPGGHTATEMGGVIQHARTRAGQLAARMWGQGMVQLGKLEVSDAQQFLSQPDYYQLADAATRRREHPLAEDGRALVGPEQVQGRIEVAPVDVTSPMRREELGEMWMRLAMTVAQNEILSAKYDADEMFEEAARLLGAKNIRDFKRRLTLPDLLLTRVVPDEQVIEQADRGNLIPLGADGHADGPTAALMQAAFQAAGEGER
jgi:hypothetical protein